MSNPDVAQVVDLIANTVASSDTHEVGSALSALGWSSQPASGDGSDIDTKWSPESPESRARIHTGRGERGFFFDLVCLFPNKAQQSEASRYAEKVISGTPGSSRVSGEESSSTTSWSGAAFELELEGGPVVVKDDQEWHILQLSLWLQDGR